MGNTIHTNRRWIPGERNNERGTPEKKLGKLSSGDDLKDLRNGSLVRDRFLGVGRYQLTGLKIILDGQKNISGSYGDKRNSVSLRYYSR